MTLLPRRGKLPCCQGEVSYPHLTLSTQPAPCPTCTLLTLCTLSTQHPLYNSALVAKARQERAAAGREERQWARQQLKEQEMQGEEQAAVRAANTLFDRHMTPLRHVFKTYSSYEEKLKRYSSPPHPKFFFA